MKKIFTLCSLVASTLFSSNLSAQFTADFEGGTTTLTGNCWTLTQMNWTGDPGEVITGSGSMLSNPPVTASSTRDLNSPALNIASTSLNVSFNYKLSNQIGGNATRTIELGLLSPSGVFTSLDIITMDKNTPTTVLSYNNTFTVTPCLRKFVVRFGGTLGDGNTRTLFDDLYVDASPLYSGASNCNPTPIAVNDNYTAPVNTVVTGNVMTNDNDPNADAMTSAIVATSPDGVVVLNANGSFSFTPNPGFSGPTATFTYRLTDNGFDPAVSNTATVTITYVAGGPLPVKLNNFQGSKNKSNVMLQWNVSINEIANTFEIERSIDGKNFATAITMFSTEKAGNETYNYSEVNESAKVYYRLKMIDRSDVVSYSKILMFNSAATGKPLNITGNVVIDKLTFSYEATANGKIEVLILDMNGKAIVKQTLNANKGNNMASISLPSAMTSGMYIAMLTAENTNSFAKFIKQ